MRLRFCQPVHLQSRPISPRNPVPEPVDGAPSEFTFPFFFSGQRLQQIFSPEPASLLFDIFRGYRSQYYAFSGFIYFQRELRTLLDAETAPYCRRNDYLTLRSYGCLHTFSYMDYFISSV